jgi:hydrogenase maturation protease
MLAGTDGERVLVIGVGNTLRGDDGVGVHVARELARGPLPEGVAVLDGGTEGLDLIFHFEEARRVVLIDAAHMGRPPGEATVFDGRLLDRATNVRFASTHGFGVAEVLALGRSIGVEPEVTIVGIQPRDTALRDGLSEPLASRLPEYVELTKGLLVSGRENPTGCACGHKE